MSKNLVRSSIQFVVFTAALTACGRKSLVVVSGIFDSLAGGLGVFTDAFGGIATDGQRRQRGSDNGYGQKFDETVHDELLRGDADRRDPFTSETARAVPNRT